MSLSRASISTRTPSGSALKSSLLRLSLSRAPSMVGANALRVGYTMGSNFRPPNCSAYPVCFCASDMVSGKSPPRHLFSFSRNCFASASKSPPSKSRGGNSRGSFSDTSDAAPRPPIMLSSSPCSSTVIVPCCALSSNSLRRARTASCATLMASLFSSSCFLRALRRLNWSLFKPSLGLPSTLRPSRNSRSCALTATCASMRSCTAANESCGLALGSIYPLSAAAASLSARSVAALSFCCCLEVLVLNAPDPCAFALSSSVIFLSRYSIVLGSRLLRTHVSASLPSWTNTASSISLLSDAALRPCATSAAISSKAPVSILYF